MSLQRYDIEAESSSIGGYVEMRPCNVVGEWVKAADAEVEIERLRKALGRIKTYTTITWIKDVCKDALERANEI